MSLIIETNDDNRNYYIWLNNHNNIGNYFTVTKHVKLRIRERYNSNKDMLKILYSFSDQLSGFFGNFESLIVVSEGCFITKGTHIITYLNNDNL